MQAKLSDKAKIVSARVLDEFFEKLNLAKTPSEEEISSIGGKAIEAAYEAAKTVDPSVVREAIAQQWYGKKSWLARQNKPEASQIQPEISKAQASEPRIEIPQKEAPEFIRARLEEARNSIALSSRISEGGRRASASFVLEGKTFNYFPADITEKSAKAPALPEVRIESLHTGISETSTLRVRLPNGIELLFDTGKHTSVSVSSSREAGDSSETYKIVTVVA